jgi:hypothetical protein
MGLSAGVYMSTKLRQKFSENAEQFDALMVEMLAENDRMRNALNVIAKWDPPILGGIPMTIHGEREYMRKIARNGLRR